MSEENADKSFKSDPEKKREPKKYPPTSPDSHSQDADRHRKISIPYRIGNWATAWFPVGLEKHKE